MRLALIVVFVSLFGSTCCQAQQWQWAKAISSGGYVDVADVIVNKTNNNEIYVVGVWNHDLSLTFPNGAIPSTNFSAAYGDYDGFVAKYDSTGTLLWAFKVGGEKEDMINAVTLDDSGNIYITGYFGKGTNYFAGTTTVTDTVQSLTSGSFFISKYNSDGEFIWVRVAISSSEPMSGLDVAANDNAVYAIGQTEAWATFGSLLMNSSPTKNDIFLIKYDFDGNEQWLVDCGGNGDDIPQSLDIDNNTLFFTGYFDGSQIKMNDKDGTTINTINNAQNGTNDAVIASYDFNGNHIWSETIRSTKDERGRGIVAVEDSIYLTGVVDNNTNFPGYSANPVTTSSGGDIFISSHAKADGKTGWVKIIPCTDTGNEQGKDIDTDGAGNLFIVGSFEEDLLFPNSVTLSEIGNDSDPFIASYTTNGTFNWALSAGSGDYENAHCVSAASVNDV